LVRRQVCVSSTDALVIFFIILDLMVPSHCVTSSSSHIGESKRKPSHTP